MAKDDLVLTTIYMQRRQRQALRDRKAATGESMSKAIRRAIDRVLAEPVRRKGGA